MEYSSVILIYRVYIYIYFFKYREIIHKLALLQCSPCMCRLFLLLVERTPASKSNIHKAHKASSYSNPHPISSSCNITTHCEMQLDKKTFWNWGRVFSSYQKLRSHIPWIGSNTPGRGSPLVYPPPAPDNRFGSFRWMHGCRRLAAVPWSHFDHHHGPWFNPWWSVIRASRAAEPQSSRGSIDFKGSRHGPRWSQSSAQFGKSFWI